MLPGLPTQEGNGNLLQTGHIQKTTRENQARRAPEKETWIHILNFLQNFK